MGKLKIRVTGYVEGMCRNEQDKVRSHLYAITDKGDYYPMCGWGWNRSDGTAYSIFRGHTSARGTCKTCQKNVDAHRAPVIGGWPHKTKWI